MNGFEQPLSEAEVVALLEADAGGVIVGGQALGLWGLYYKVPLPEELNTGISADLDFFGDRRLARQFASHFESSRVTLPDSEFDPETPNSAVVVIENLLGRRGRMVRVDFLLRLKGLDVETLEKRAAKIQISGVSGKKRVMHPFDCLLSRVANLQLAKKQNSKGVAQARFAVQVFKKYLESLLNPDQGGRTDALHKSAERFAEMVVSVAKSDSGLSAYSVYRIDAIEAIPLEAYSPEFRHKTWPVLLREVQHARES